MKVDGVRVFGYSAWSLVDGFEWTNGFKVRRGLFYVDFSQANRTRSPKTSAQYYRHVVTNDGFPDDDTSREVKGRFPCEFHWGVADSTVQVGIQRQKETTNLIWKVFLTMLCSVCVLSYRCASTLSRHSSLTHICTDGT